MIPALFAVLLAVLVAPPQRSTYVVPSFGDLTIRTRETRGLWPTMVTSHYFKGARQRGESRPDSAGRLPFTATILQCDQKTLIRLFLHSKTYQSSIDHLLEPNGTRPRPPSKVQSTGPEVDVTINSIDTGERRKVGSYEALHIKSTITVQPTAGAAAKVGKVEADGWYLDLPGLNCREDVQPTLLTPLYLPLLAHQSPDQHDRVVVNRVGVEPHGLLIEGISRQISDGNRILNKTEFLGASEEPIDESLFEVPPDFTPGGPGPMPHRGNAGGDTP